MYTHSGEIKANKRDIEDIKTFIRHARMDMDFGSGGSYVDHKADGEALDNKELASGKRGLELVEYLLEALCPKWTNYHQHHVSIHITAATHRHARALGC
jgi:hypothetical protein